MNKKTLQVMMDGSQAERRYLAEKDFGLFFAYYFIDYIKYKFAPFHHQMFRDLMDLDSGKYREVLFLMFRESAKTSISKAFITWLLVFKKRQYILVDSYTRENAERILFDIANVLVTNTKILEDFGNIYSDETLKGKTQKRVDNFLVHNKEIRIEAFSTQENPRGRLHKHVRPDFYLFDDFETNKTKVSKAITKQIISHMDEARSGMSPDGSIIYLGNYISNTGSIQTLLDRAKTDEKLLVRNIPIIQDGEPTWQEKYVLTDAQAEETGKVSIEDKKRFHGSIVFEAEFMNNPFNEENQVFFKRYFKHKPLSYLETIKTRKFAVIDTAISKTDESDFTGVCVTSVDEANNWYVQSRGIKVNAKGIIDLIFQLHDDGCEKIGIETTAYTEAIQPFLEDEMAVRGKYPRIEQLKHGGKKKEMRIEGLVPKYEAGHIYHIEGHTTTLEEQLLTFPMSLYDDELDAEAYMLQMAEPAYPKQNLDYLDEELLHDDIGI